MTDYQNIFTDCFSLEELYLPNAVNLPAIFPSSEEENSKTMQVVIKENSISLLIGQNTTVLKRSDGKWNYVVAVADYKYKEPLSHYTSLLCEEIIAGSK